MIDVNSINIQTVNLTDSYGEFVMDFLPRGYGNTLGTPLRRALLMSMQGSAITSVKIAGVKHEFSTIAGVKEDVLKILLNLKKVIVRNYTDKPQTLVLNVKGPKVVTAADIEETSSVEVVNKDMIIAELTAKNTSLEMELTVENGVGYVIADSLKRAKIGNIPLDANFSPIERVAMEVLPTRSGQETDLDKLVLRIWTKGNISPSEALHNAIEHIKSVFTGLNGLDLPEKKSVEVEEKKETKKAKTAKTTTKKKTAKK